MNEFAPRIDMMAADRINTARPALAAAAVQPSSSAGNLAGGTGEGADSGEQARRDHMASIFDYARVQARIADILADVDAARTGAATVQDTATSHLEMLRQPVVIIPMPPASVEAIERAVELARDMAEQAAMTRSAQANVPVSMVNQLLAMPA